MEITVDNRNELFKRNEVEALLVAEKNPSFDEVRKLLSEKFKKPEENIDVRNILGKFGSKNFTIFANIYDNKEDKQALGRKPKQKEEKSEVKPTEQASVAETEKPQVQSSEEIKVEATQNKAKETPKTENTQDANEEK